MKKEIPYLIKIPIESNAKETESIIFWRFNDMIEKQYRFPKHDFDLYCAILIRSQRIDELSESFQNYILIDGEIRSELDLISLLYN